jgi:hypothetical protein
MSWLLLLSFLAGIYILVLTAYRLFQAVKKMSEAAARTSKLLADLTSYEQIQPAAAKASGPADLQRALAARRKLVSDRRRRRETQQRRLVKRIREIEIDKRWS